MMADASGETRTRTARQVRADLRTAQQAVSLAEARYMESLLTQLTAAEARQSNIVGPEPDERSWIPVSQGGQLNSDKYLPESRTPETIRHQAYRLWRYQPHARGILRNLERFIIGKEFGIDFQDLTRGQWTDETRTKLKVTTDENDKTLVQLVWDDNVRLNKGKQRAKEIVRRAFRDSEAFVRKFVRSNKVYFRFIEPGQVLSPGGASAQTQDGPGVQADDLFPMPEGMVGQDTTICEGIEYLKDDVETVVAYHVRKGDNYSGVDTSRIPAKDVYHLKPLADLADLHGIALLEVVFKRLANYDQWEEYRMILNKVRTAVALVRKVDGTALQAQSIIQGRQSPNADRAGREPMTRSGMREAMPAPGTIFTPGPGVSYEMMSPNLNAADASEDGRRFLLSISAGVGMPEMLVTGDWSNGNFASVVEARTPAVREWEDWQEFFEPCFIWMVEAVLREAHALGLPEDVDEEFSISWPNLITRDRAKETERNVALNAAHILSKKTWSADEELDYEEQQENFREEDAENPNPMLPLGGAPGAPGAPGMPALPGTTPPTATNPTGAERPTTEALQEALDQLHTDVELIDDPSLRTALQSYMGQVEAMVGPIHLMPRKLAPIASPENPRVEALSERVDALAAASAEAMAQMAGRPVEVRVEAPIQINLPRQKSPKPPVINNHVTVPPAPVIPPVGRTTVSRTLKRNADGTIDLKEVTEPEVLEEVKDASGHEHAGPGSGGGQFISGGSGGGTSDMAASIGSRGGKSSAPLDLSDTTVTMADRFPASDQDPPPGKSYEYHTTSAKSLAKIASDGLSGEHGQISVAPHLESAHFWANAMAPDGTRGGAPVYLLRMSRDDLKKNGIPIRYPDDEGNSSGTPTPQEDHEETREHWLTPRGKNVPASAIQIYFKGSWRPLTVAVPSKK